MSSTSFRFLGVVIFLSGLTLDAGASDADAERASWDQERAVEVVRGVLELEAQGQSWDRIEWVTDADEAARLAQEQDKPLLVYFYLRKPVGPDDAPC